MSDLANRASDVMAGTDGAAIHATLDNPPDARRRSPRPPMSGRPAYGSLVRHRPGGVAAGFVCALPAGDAACLAAFTAAPDVDAFIGGVQLGLSVALIVAALLGAASLVRRILGA
ncbi:MAG: hypothetical protein U0R70_08365 [Solirubrobacteraceae bacterium]